MIYRKRELRLLKLLNWAKVDNINKIGILLT